MKPLEDYLMPTEKDLFNMIRKMYRGKAISRKGSFILVLGEAPVMLLAHLDTVHHEPVRDICKTKNGNILMSPQGIGGDDRCGVYAINTVYESAPVKPWLLFTCGEEIGGVGAHAFASEHERGKMPEGLDDLKFLIEIDRKGSKDAVYYDCDNEAFEEYITGKGFVTAEGSFSDISVVAPELGVAAVNLSSGYYNAHTLHEYINRRHLNAVVQKVQELVFDAAQPETPRYEYVERVYNFGKWRFYGDDKWWSGWDGAGTKSGVKIQSQVPKDLPSEYANFYDELLDLYTAGELEAMREQYGDQVIWQLYESEYGPYYEALRDDEEREMQLMLEEAEECSEQV